MINSESQMLSGGAGYETQVELYIITIIGNSGGVPCIASRSRGWSGQNSCMYKNKKPFTALNCELHSEILIMPS